MKPSTPSVSVSWGSVCSYIVGFGACLGVSCELLFSLEMGWDGETRNVGESLHAAPEPGHASRRQCTLSSSRP